MNRWPSTTIGKLLKVIDNPEQFSAIRYKENKEKNIICSDITKLSTF